METVATIKKNNDLLDLIKLILSFMVVAIHTGLFDPFLYPWLRLAVPLFFIISSYLFFTKINACQSDKEQLFSLKGFILRNLMLYAFWFVVLLPFSIILLGWFDNGFLSGILYILKNFFLGSTFFASWFIMALVIGVAVVFFVSKKLGNKALLTIGAILFVLVSIRSSYMFIFKETEWAKDILASVIKYESVMNRPVNSFPAGIFWVVCGKIFADGAFTRFKIKESSIVLTVSLILLLVEWLVTKSFSGYFNTDSLLMLAPSCLAIFNILIQLKPIDLKYNREMRKMSVIIYTSHGTIILGLNKLFETAGQSVPAVVIFLLTVGICMGCAFLIFLLEKKKYFTWLKYSH